MKIISPSVLESKKGNYFIKKTNPRLGRAGMGKAKEFIIFFLWWRPVKVMERLKCGRKKVWEVVAYILFRSRMRRLLIMTERASEKAYTWCCC